MTNATDHDPKPNPRADDPAPPYEVPGEGVTQPPASYQSPAHHSQPQSLPLQTNANFQGNNPMVVSAMPLGSLGSYPALIDCPFCNTRVQTRIQEEHSSMTLVAGIGLGLLCICCACIPCLAHWCQDVDHFCSRCNQRVAHVPYNGITQPVHPTIPPQGYNMAKPQPYGNPQTSSPPQQGDPKQGNQQQGAGA
ncbi:LITAF-like zinc ribbon domain-containing protein [Xylariaceae sp. FL0662B]|nr:LITAF-like zinc ribbon domain-containing protein [Xylariaceae sp. FL0662B]